MESNVTNKEGAVWLCQQPGHLQYLRECGRCQRDPRQVWKLNHLLSLTLAEGCQGQRVSHTQAEALLQGVDCKEGDTGAGMEESSQLQSEQAPRCCLLQQPPISSQGKYFFPTLPLSFSNSQESAGTGMNCCPLIEQPAPAVSLSSPPQRSPFLLKHLIPGCLLRAKSRVPMWLLYGVR